MEKKTLDLSPSQNTPYVGPETPRSLVHRFANAYPGLWESSGCNATEFVKRRVVKVVLQASYSKMIVRDAGFMDDDDLSICRYIETFLPTEQAHS